MTTPILGYDCDGRALRAGDRVVYLGDIPADHGQEFTILGPVEDYNLRARARCMGRRPEEYVMLNDDSAALSEVLRLINSGRDEFYKAVQKVDNEPVTV